MIGGTDEIIPVADEAAALDHSLRALSRLWPHAVYEDADTGEAFANYAQINFGGRRDFFVFRDKDAADKWEELGADESLDGTMIHFLSRPRELTIVVDSNPPQFIHLFLQALRRSLRQDLFESVAEAA
jgi:hypothetical protein